jgi:tetratricopeptide (TPR) repeat protein
MIKVSGLTLLALFVATAGWGRGSQNQPSSQGNSSGSGAQSTPPSQPPPSGQLPGSQPAGPSGQLPGSGQPAAAPQANPQEDAAYKVFYDARTGDPQKQILLGEDFIKKYPTSKYLGVVYAGLAADYLNTGDEDKMFSSAQKSIDADPDNVDSLSLMVWAGARRVNAASPDAAERFAKLENYAHHAITLIASMTKPNGMDDATFNAARNDKLSMCHSGLGLMDYVRQRYPDAITELTQAVQLANTPDQVDYFILGRADENASHFDDAISAFGKCSDLGGQLAPNCKAGIDDAKKRELTSAQPQPSH